MAIQYEVLGPPERDNALLVTVDTGHRIDRLLFDCGDRCLEDLSTGRRRDIDHVFFSHFHMDHVCGFDSWFRWVFGRTERPNVIWGPPGAAAILQHRFQGFVWNLLEDAEATWYVHEVYPRLVRRTRFELAEAFSVAHPAGDVPRDGTAVLTTPEYTVHALAMKHHGTSLAWAVRESPRLNLDIAKVTALGLPSGPWMNQLKSDEEGEVDLGGQTWSLAALREAVLQSTPGMSIAYLTDFLLDPDQEARLVPFLQGCMTVVCEAAYRAGDVELAEQNHHMTTQRSGRLAARAEVGRLVLFHLSARYTPEEWAEMLAEARAEFPATRFPVSWGLD